MHKMIYAPNKQPAQGTRRNTIRYEWVKIVGQNFIVCNMELYFNFLISVLFILWSFSYYTLWCWQGKHPYCVQMRISTRMKWNPKETENVGFEVFMAVVMKSSIFWHIMPCGPLKFNRRFEGTCHLHLQGAYSSTLKMEATCSSEKSVDFQQTTQRYIPEDRTLQTWKCSHSAHVST
jgi:hypothetical protein